MALGSSPRGDPKWVERQLAKVVLLVVDLITVAGMELSQTNSVVSASSEELGKACQGRLRTYGATFVRRAKSL